MLLATSDLVWKKIADGLRVNYLCLKHVAREDMPGHVSMSAIVHKFTEMYCSVGGHSVRYILDMYL